MFLGLKNIENNNETEHKIIPISVIICAKNEIDNLKAHLLSWLNQNYAQFEVIIVNDGSTDGSKEWLDEQAEKFSLLKVIHIDKNEKKHLKGKRHALNKGIKEAKYEYLALTDADCYPATNYWLAEMNKGFNKKDVILGFSPYEEKKGWLNLLIQYDTFLTAVQYLGWANKGAPYMGVGRNVGYKKSLINSEIMANSNKSLSGDDDLVVAQIANAENTYCLISQNSMIISKPETTFKNWVNQKTRHYSAGSNYSFSNKIIAGMFPMANVLWYLIFFLSIIVLPIFDKLFFVQKFLPFIFLLYFTKALIFITISHKLKQKFNLTIKVFYCYVILDLIYWSLFVFFQIKHIFRAQNGWSTKKN